MNEAPAILKKRKEDLDTKCVVLTMYRDELTGLVACTLP
jgi:hypothetical protein